jgi:hypothetical protein
MSEAFLLAGDLAFPPGALARWRRLPIDATAVGPLPEHVSSLQPSGILCVGALEKALQRIPSCDVEVQANGSRWRLRGGITDHDLHDLAAPLVAAFRLARTLGATGELVIALDADPPSFAHRLRLAEDDALVTLSPRAARALAEHAGLGEVRAKITLTVEAALREAAPPPRRKPRAPKLQPPAGPLHDLDGAHLIQAVTHRLETDPRAAFEELAPHLAAGARTRGTGEKLLHATCAVLGQDLIVYQRARQTRDVLRDEPRWVPLIADILADEQVHAHFREGALRALAATGDARHLPLVARHAEVADAMTLASAIADLGEGAADAIRATVHPRTAEEIEVLLEESAKRRRRRRR